MDYYRRVTTSPFLFDSDQTYKYNSLAFEKKQIKLDIVMLVVQCFWRVSYKGVRSEASWFQKPSDKKWMVAAY